MCLFDGVSRKYDQKLLRSLSRTQTTDRPVDILAKHRVYTLRAYIHVCVPPLSTFPCSGPTYIHSQMSLGRHHDPTCGAN